MNSPSRNLLRRLERDELANLRIAVTRLARRVDELEAKLEDAEARAYNAQLIADQWHDIANSDDKQVTLVLQR